MYWGFWGHIPEGTRQSFGPTFPSVWFIVFRFWVFSFEAFGNPMAGLHIKHMEVLVGLGFSQ